MPRRTPRITAGHVAVLIATGALFVALDGPTHAAKVITGADIKNNSVASKDIKNNTIKSGDVKDDSLTGADVLESSLAKVPSAATADTATTVPDNAITGPKLADNSVTGAEVTDRSLTPADIAQGSGVFTANIGSVAPNGCDFSIVTLEPGVDFRDSAILVTPNDPIGGLNISVTATQSNSVGLARLVACNPTGVAIDPASNDFAWIAFDVS